MTVVRNFSMFIIVAVVTIYIPTKQTQPKKTLSNMQNRI